MISQLIDGVLILVFLIITVQDISFRRIHVFSIVIILVLSIWKAFNLYDIRTIAFESALIISFLLLQLVLVQMYFKLRKGDWVQIDRQIGWGDVLLLIVIIPLFTLKSYAFFYCTSIIFSLLIYAIIRLSKLSTDNRIPLAAYLSIYLIILLGINFINTIPFRL